MTDIAIKNQLEALKFTTQQALKSKKASLELLAKLGLIPAQNIRQRRTTSVKVVVKTKAN